VAAQAFALDLRLRQYAVSPERYEPTFRSALAQLVESGHRGVVFGNIHLDDVRAWFEDRVRGAGLEHVEPVSR
jgi:diphthamide synthase (EF-2-diphthine--ammonia ligase)